MTNASRSQPWRLLTGIALLALPLVACAGASPAPEESATPEAAPILTSNSQASPAAQAADEEPEGEEEATAAVDFTPQAAIVPVSVDEQLQRFVLQPGYRLEAVLTERRSRSRRRSPSTETAACSSSRCAPTCRTSTEPTS